MIEEDDEDMGFGEVFYDAETGEKFYYAGDVDEDELNEDYVEIDPSNLFSHKDTSHLSVISEYYEVDGTFIDSEKQYVGRTNTHNVNDLYNHVRSETFFETSKNECTERNVGLKLIDIFAYVEKRNEETILLYVQYKVELLNEKEEE